MGTSIDPEYDIDYNAICPKCGHVQLHYRSCTSLFCEDGYFDESEEDPINFSPGERLVLCEECRGTGVEVWCPKCGVNLSGENVLSPDENYDFK